MSDAAGYSGTPLPKKLGLKDGQAVVFIGMPDSLGYLSTSRDFAVVKQVQGLDDIPEGKVDVAHIFTKEALTLNVALPILRDAIAPDGMIWVSWPKKASKVPTDITEDVIRTLALSDILVDVKVCAVDDVWSGLKLVIRKELR